MQTTDRAPSKLSENQWITTVTTYSSIAVLKSICVEFGPEVMWSIMASFMLFSWFTSMPGTSTWKMLTFS